jgi:hypothetical protein
LPAVVREVGAVAGLAGLVGVATLWSLCWSQARDVRRLREWAGGAPERPRRVGPRAVAIGLVGVLLVVGAAAALTGGGEDDGARGADRAQAKDDNKATRPRPRHVAPAVVPGEVTVAVLNGTTVPGLAAALRDRVVAAGFGKGIINVFSDQRLAASVVQYAPGRQAAARAVGRALGIGRSEPLAATGRILAGDATVVVIAGTDVAP